LLYLVPGCILAVLITSFIKGEFTEMWDFSEDEYITPPEQEDDDSKKSKVEDDKDK
jgi:hypothetical protein